MKVVALLLGIVVLASCASRPAAPGRMVDVDGHQMHLYCTGPRDAVPTVIIDGGQSSIVPFYAHIQQGVARQFPVCSYDRAGLGWSAPAGTPREARQMAQELHTLLHTAGVAPPYVLAGHSIGGLIVLRYQYDFPEDVAGLVLLDSSHPDQEALFFDNEAKVLAAEQADLKLLGRLRILMALGLPHIYNPYRAWFKTLPPDAARNALYFTTQTSMIEPTMGEVRGRRASFAQAGEVETLGDLPLLVFTAGASHLPDSDDTDEQVARKKRYHEGWDRLHTRFAALSSRGRHITLEKAEHLTLITDPANAQVVVDEIVKLAAETQHAARAE